MKSNAVSQLLEKLQLSSTGTIYFFEEKNNWAHLVSPEITRKLSKIQPDAFYLFNNQPYMLFFDLTPFMFREEREQEIHKQVWSFDQSPVVFIIKEKDIELFNALAFDKKKNKLEKIKLQEGETLESLFSFWNLQSGDTWRWLQEKHYKKNIHEKRVNQKLFENIKAVREALINKMASQLIDEGEANILILRLIFIRYLIDRGVKLESRYIDGISLFERRKNFSDLIRNPNKLNSFFEWLNVKFNGVLFKDIKIVLSEELAYQLSQVFKGEIPENGSLFEGTDYYFEIFDFSIIPVELISGIYESLIDKDTRKLHSAVYTPAFLVEYMLKHTIDNFLNDEKNSDRSECCVFDPSVGSGIFLVQAFRRMVDKEILLKGSITRIRLREIVYNNLFGIDINEQALKVTCFSIYIAMLDYFEPSSILPNFEFPNLIGSNLFAANFFDLNHKFNTAIGGRSVDFILGNPPWKSDKDQFHLNWLDEQNKVVGRFEIAQSFLLRSKDFMSSNTETALIVTSTIFYNVFETTKTFKRNFLSQFCIKQFFDLSPVRRLIFEEKNSPCAIVFYKIDTESHYLSNVVKHLSIKANIFLKYYKTLVIEKFDQKEINQKHFIENDWMFKVALYGNTLDFSLLKKLKKDRLPIISLINGKDTFKGAGIKSNKGKKFANFLIGSPLIENGQIQDYFTTTDESNKILTAEDVYYESGRRKELFEGYKILIKEQARNESNLVISFNEGNGVFKNGIWGISSKDETKIKELYSLLISKLYTYYIFITACSWGVATRPQIRLDEEYLSFPYTGIDNLTKNKLLDLVSQFLSPYKHFYSEFNLGEPQYNIETFDEINRIVDKLYDIEGYEKDLINYVLDISRYQFQESKYHRVIRKVNNDYNVLKDYAEVFINGFQNIYFNEFMHVKVYPSQHFIAMTFEFSESEPNANLSIFKDITDENELLTSIASSLSISKITEDLYIQKDVKGFEENLFYIIKPNEYKCWHRAIAWYDLAEFKKVIEETEIDYLNAYFDE